eukprot:CAMPEP_0202726716 /NCGR_PEP_ID=MMETSP1385-20130828/184754_1 /ASSEMBLY_ACC=CAM_ASM_000861 /TAXON_ID=933848 /ORGANISM="Elphidium margaritaceum" /LENGTH=882 /DNA_ID=CAMNT_0049392943 /DNA_START=37 /DNA_END=2686 /DNA_ORIENTATION=-
MMLVKRLLQFVVVTIYNVCAQLQCTQHSQSLPTAVSNLILGFSNASQTAYLLGGWVSAPVDDVRKWDTKSPSNFFTSLVTPAPTAMICYGGQIVASINDVLYVVSPRTLTSSPWTTGSAIYRFNTATEQWLSPISFSTPLGQYLIVPCVTHNDTHIILVDGFDSSRADGPIYILFYDISQNSWTTHTLSVPFSATGNVKGGWWATYCSYVQESVYIFGGTYYPPGSSANVDLSGIYKYEIATRELVSLGVLPMTQVSGTALYDGSQYIYLVGGLTTGSQVLDAIRIFDVSTETLLAETIEIRVTNTVSMILDEKLWIFGGYDGNQILDAVQTCDISSFTSNPTTANPPVYIFGGTYYPPGSSNWVDQNGIYKYEIATRELVSLGVLPMTQVSGTALYDGSQYIYLVGGLTTGSQVLDAIRIFDVSTETLLAETIDIRVANTVSMILGEKLWIFGGYDGNQILDAVQTCDISSFTSNPTTANPTTANPTTTNPSTANPSTANPTTANSTTTNPSTANPTTRVPSTTWLSVSNTSNNPTTTNPTSANTSTANPTTRVPSTTWLSVSNTSNNVTVVYAPTSPPIVSSEWLHNYAIIIETDDLSSTQILLVVENAFNLSTVAFTLTSTSTDDDGSVVVELLVAISDTQLDYDVIDETLREAMVEEYGGDVDVDITVLDDAQTTRQPTIVEEFSWLWVGGIAVCVFGVCGCCVFAVVVYKKKQRGQRRYAPSVLQPPPPPPPLPQQQQPRSQSQKDVAGQIEMFGRVLSHSASNVPVPVVDQEDEEEKKDDVELEGVDKAHDNNDKFVYDPNMNYKVEGERASIVTTGAEQRRPRVNDAVDETSESEAVYAVNVQPTASAQNGTSGRITADIDPNLGVYELNRMVDL